VKAVRTTRNVSLVLLFIPLSRLLCQPLHSGVEVGRLAFGPDLTGQFLEARVALGVREGLELRALSDVGNVGAFALAKVNLALLWQNEPHRGVILGNPDREAFCPPSPRFFNVELYRSYFFLNSALSLTLMADK
jgi:hypothetical protein